MRRHEDADRGSKTAQMRASGIRRPQPGQRFGDRRRMVGKVVVHRHAASGSHDFQSPLDAGEPAQPLGDPLGRNPDVSRDRNGGVALRTLCAPTSGTSKVPYGAPRTPDLEPRRRASRLEIVRLPIQALGCAEGLDSRLGGAGQPARPLAVSAKQQQAAPRHEVHEAAKRQRHRLDVGIDVGVIELNVVDDRDVRQVLEELGGLVEERAVVFVAFDDEVAALPHAIAGSVLAEVARDAADEHARIERRASVSTHPASAVVVVFPCVPAITIDRAPHRKCSRIASGSEQ